MAALYLVPRQGLEPQFSQSKCDVLPLDDLGLPVLQMGFYHKIIDGLEVSFAGAFFNRLLKRHLCFLNEKQSLPKIQDTLADGFKRS